MSYSITITADTLREFAGKVGELAAQLAADAPSTPAAAPAQKAPAKPKTETAPKDDKPKEEKAPAEKPKEEKAPTTGPVEDFPAKAREAVLGFMAKKGAGGREALEAILSEFGVAKVTQVGEDQQAEILARLRVED